MAHYVFVVRRPRACLCKQRLIVRSQESNAIIHCFFFLEINETFFEEISNHNLQNARVQTYMSAPLNFSTLLCKDRYQKIVIFAERCLFYRLISTAKQRINGIHRKICDLTQKPTAKILPLLPMA